MDGIQSKIRTLLYSIFTGIVGIILIRVLLKLVGVEDGTNDFAAFWYDFSSFFIEPWAIIYKSISLGTYSIIEIYSIIAMLFYIIIASILTKSAVSVFEDTRKEVILQISDSFFKVLEFLLISRFVFKLTDASETSSFVRLIYDLSEVVYQPFEGMLPAIHTAGMTIEVTTVLALVIIIILDIITEQIIASILETVLPEPKARIQQAPVYQAPRPQQQVQSQPPLQPAQNINISIPQAQPSKYYDQRSVNVQQPKQSKPQRKGMLNWPKKRSSRAGGPATS